MPTSTIVEIYMYLHLAGDILSENFTSTIVEIYMYLHRPPAAWRRASTSTIVEIYMYLHHTIAKLLILNELYK